MTYDALADFRMTGHNVIITGGAQNIGAGIAKTLSGAGAKVMIADLNGDMAQETAASIQKDTGNECRGMKCDVTSLDDINAVVKATVEAFGGISTLMSAGAGAMTTQQPSPRTPSSPPTSSTPSAPIA